MKRFYCTVCKKVKRVQNLPIVIENEIADNPVNRIGVCNHHSNPKPHFHAMLQGKSEQMESFAKKFNIPVVKIKRSK